MYYAIYDNQLEKLRGEGLNKTSKKQIKYLKDTENLNIKPRTIDDFIRFLETSDRLFEMN